MRRARVETVALVFVAMAIPTVTHASGRSGVAEAVGEANILNDDLVQAKKAATADALKKAVEKIVGIYVASEFTAEQRETVQNNQATFTSKVQDTLLQKSEGFIDTHEVLAEKREGNIFKVKVRAKVFESKLKAEAQALADLLRAAGNPKLMVVIQDVLIRDGRRQVARESVLASYLEKELLDRGFELRQNPQAGALAARSEADYDQWLNNSAAVATLARDAGADLVVAGRVEIVNKGKIDDARGFAALQGQVRVEITSVIRGVNAASGELFSSSPVQTLSIGTNEERAIHRAFKGRGGNMVKTTFDSLLSDLKSSFERTANAGQAYVLRLRGVRSFRQQGKAFMDMVRALNGVQQVKQKSFENGELELDVACKCSGADLQNAIFTAVDGTDLSQIDIENVSGKKLTFKL